MPLPQDSPAHVECAGQGVDVFSRSFAKLIYLRCVAARSDYFSTHSNQDLWP
jgi:hypothetical protein